MGRADPLSLPPGDGGGSSGSSHTYCLFTRRADDCEGRREIGRILSRRTRQCPDKQGQTQRDGRCRQVQQQRETHFGQWWIPLPQTPGVIRTWYIFKYNFSLLVSVFSDTRMLLRNRDTLRPNFWMRMSANTRRYLQTEGEGGGGCRVKSVTWLCRQKIVRHGCPSKWLKVATKANSVNSTALG